MRRPPPLPLLEWRPALARELRIRRRPILVLGGIGLAFMALTTTLDFGIKPAPRLVWNASASAPIGLWRIHPGTTIRTGDMVLVTTPAAVRNLAATRHYLPANVPLLKRVVAMDGDFVCALGPDIYINGQPMAQRLIVDRKGRPLPWWNGCEKLAHGRLFLTMYAPDSFDGRYFGPVDAASVIGKATPLWLR